MPQETPTEPTPQAICAHAQVLSMRARDSTDRKARVDLKRLFDEHSSLLIEFGRGRIDEIVRDLLTRHSVRSGDRGRLEAEARSRVVDQVQAQLEGPCPTPIESLLSAHAALTWLELACFDELITERFPNGLAGREAADLDRFRDRAQRRYLRSLNTLATVRKLAVPAIQVNLAGQQVNLNQFGGEA
jgi:hypothetical protein